MACGEYTGTAWACRDGVWKAKAHLQLNLVRAMKGRKLHEQQKEDQGNHGPTAEYDKGPGDKKIW